MEVRSSFPNPSPPRRHRVASFSAIPISRQIYFLSIYPETLLILISQSESSS